MKKTKKNVLICDDDPFILELLKLLLERDGHQVIQETCPEMLIGSAVSTKPDLILVDLNLHGFCGAELTSKLKSNAATCDIRIVLISGASDISQIAENTKADGYLLKPFDIARVQELVS